MSNFKLKTKTFFLPVSVFFLFLIVAESAWAGPIEINYKDFIKLDASCDEIPGCIKLLLNAVVKLAFPIAGIFILWSGFLFVSAVGDPKKLEKARKTLLWTVIGLFIVIGAWALSVAFQSFFKNPQ